MDSKIETSNLLPNLGNKEKYILYEINLWQAVGAGLVITKIHIFLLFDSNRLMVCLAGDIYVHADLHGASSVVIKNSSRMVYFTS